MIFRYLLRRDHQRLDRRLLLPEDYKDRLENGGYDWISEMSEWRAFRHLFFSMSIIREADPKDLRELQRMIEKVLADTERKKDDSETSA